MFFVKRSTFAPRREARVETVRLQALSEGPVCFGLMNAPHLATHSQGVLEDGQLCDGRGRRAGPRRVRGEARRRLLRPPSLLRGRVGGVDDARDDDGDVVRPAAAPAGVVVLAEDGEVFTPGSVGGGGTVGT